MKFNFHVFVSCRFYLRLHYFPLLVYNCVVLFSTSNKDLILLRVF